MNLPDLIKSLVKAQNTHDSIAYANCFTLDSVIFDEGKNHRGRNEVKAWIEGVNIKYQTVMEPIAYSGSGKLGLLSARISGTFEGSPIVFKYHLEFTDGLIKSLKISD